MNRALEDYQQALRLNPNDLSGRLSRASIYSDLRQDDQALTDLNEALRLAPNDAYALSLRGFTWMRKGRSDLALSDLSAAIRLNPKDWFACYGRAQIWSGRQEEEKALSDFDESIRRGPDLPANHKAYQRRAWIRATARDATLRDPVIAVASAKKACQLTAWKDADCLRTLAAVYSELADFDAALTTIEKATALLRPGDPRTESFRELSALFREKRPYHESGVSMKRANPS